MKENDGTMEEMQEDEVLFDKTYKDPVKVSTSSESLTQATSHNIIVLHEKILET